MLSIFPTQIIKSWGEWLIVPLMDWLLLTFLPLNSVYKASHASLAAANGQFILFDKESYFSFGGHEKIKSKVVEDMEFARGFKQNGFKVITFLGNNLVNCRMYRNLNEALNGFSKNFYPGFNISGTAFSSLILLLFTLFIFPFILIYFNFLFTIIAGLIITERIFTSSLSKQNQLKNIILFLPQIFMLIIIGIKSLVDNKRKKVIWKGRNIK
jgi:chlorobactene glucosyltransferase